MTDEARTASRRCVAPLLFRFSRRFLFGLSAAFFLDPRNFLLGLFNDRLLFLTYRILFLYISLLLYRPDELSAPQIVRICKTQLYLCFRELLRFPRYFFCCLFRCFRFRNLAIGGLSVRGQGIVSTCRKSG